MMNNELDDLDRCILQKLKILAPILRSAFPTIAIDAVPRNLVYCTNSKNFTYIFLERIQRLIDIGEIFEINFTSPAKADSLLCEKNTTLSTDTIVRDELLDTIKIVRDLVTACCSDGFTNDETVTALYTNQGRLTGVLRKYGRK